MCLTMDDLRGSQKTKVYPSNVEESKIQYSFCINIRSPQAFSDFFTRHII